MRASLREYEELIDAVVKAQQWGNSEKARFHEAANKAFTKLLDFADKIAMQQRVDRRDVRKFRERTEKYVSKLVAMMDKILKDKKGALTSPVIDKVWRLETLADGMLKERLYGNDSNIGDVISAKRRAAGQNQDHLEMFWGSAKFEALVLLGPGLDRKLVEKLEESFTQALNNWQKATKGSDNKALAAETEKVMSIIRTYDEKILFLKHTGPRGEPEKKATEAYYHLLGGLGAIAEQMALRLRERG